MAKGSIKRAGFLRNNAGTAIEGATVELFAKNATTTALASTTTNSSGYWAFDYTTANAVYDVRITSGSSVRFHSYDVKEQMTELEVKFLNIRELGDDYTYSILPSDLAGNRTLTLPVLTNDDTLAVLGLAQTFSAAQTFTSTVTVGSDGSGTDVIFYSGTAGDNLTWDASEEQLIITGTNGATSLNVADGNVAIADDLAVDGTSNLDNTDIDGTLAVDGTTISLDATTSLNIDNSNTSNGVTIGTATSGVPISIGHATSETTINDNLTVTGTVDIGSGTIDGVTLGTNSVITQAVIDEIDINGKVITMTGDTNDTVVFTAGTAGTLSIVTTDAGGAAANIQITADGTVDIDSAGVLTLDSGAAINLEPASGSAVLIDGTVSIDAGVVTGATSITSSAYNVGSDTLAEYISDTVGAMVTSNTESGITVAYQDGDNTLDFTVGTLNQDTTGTAAIATTVTITDNESTDENNVLVFVAGADADGGDVGLESDGDLTYNPSTGTLASTIVTGQIVGTGATVFNDAGADVDFRIESDDDANMLVVNGGDDRVGIGVADPVARLDIKSAGASTTAFQVTADDNTDPEVKITLQGDRRPWLQIYQGNTEKIRLDGGGESSFTGDVVAANHTQPSDSRLKTNIQTIGSALTKVCQMRGVSFDSLDVDKSSSGVVAQEMELIAPEVVSTLVCTRIINEGEADEATVSNVKGVNYSALIGYLIEAVKELNAKI